MVIQGYKSAVQTIKHVNESSNHISDEGDRPPTPSVQTNPLVATTISKRLSDASSLFSVSSQQRQASPERDQSAEAQMPDHLRYAETPLTMIATIFGLNKRYAASAIANTLDMLTSLFMPFLDKFCPGFLCQTILY